MALTHQWKISKIRKYPSKTVSYETGDVNFTDYVCFIGARLRTFDSGTPDNYVEKDVILDWTRKPQDPPTNPSDYVEFADLTEEQLVAMIKNSSIHRKTESIMEEKYAADWGAGIWEESDNPFDHEEFRDSAPDAAEMQSIAEEANSENQDVVDTTETDS